MHGPESDVDVHGAKPASVRASDRVQPLLEAREPPGPYSIRGIVRRDTVGMEIELLSAEEDRQTLGPNLAAGLSQS